MIRCEICNSGEAKEYTHLEEDFSLCSDCKSSLTFTAKPDAMRSENLVIAAGTLATLAPWAWIYMGSVPPWVGFLFSIFAFFGSLSVLNELIVEPITYEPRLKAVNSKALGPGVVEISPGLYTIPGVRSVFQTNSPEPPTRMPDDEYSKTIAGIQDGMRLHHDEMYKTVMEHTEAAGVYLLSSVRGAHKYALAVAYQVAMGWKTPWEAHPYDENGKYIDNPNKSAILNLDSIRF